MNIEMPQGQPESYEPTLEELEAADKRIEENEVLRDNPRVKALQENNFVTEDGRQLVANDFLDSMLDYLATQSEPVTQEELDAEIEEQMVVHARATR